MTSSGVVSVMANKLSLIELGVHNMQKTSCKAEPGDYKHALNTGMQE